MGDLRRVNYEDKDLFVEYLINRLGLLTESYTVHPISKITFSYIIKDGLATDKDRRLLQDLTDKSLNTHRFNNLNLPISMNPADYGTITVDNYIQINGESVHRFYVVSGTRSYLIDVSNEGFTNNVSIQGAVDLKWVDTKISDGVFMREIGKSIIYFMGGERILTKKLLSAKPFRKVSTDKTLNSDFVTMDIETIKVNKNITPYLICAYNGTDYISSFADKSLDQKALFTSFINQLLTFFSKNSKTLTVYAHNLSKFDGVFLFNQTFEFGVVKPKYHNQKIISFKLKLNVTGYKNKTIIFKDSMLMLPLSLRALCKSFDVTSIKSYFPFKLANIFYTGVLPAIEYWTDITLSEYELLFNRYTGIEWNFKEEAVKYCKLDCQSLHEILVKFNELIYSNFKINIKDTLTLPSLAMRIYKALYMPEGAICQLGGAIESDIRQSYSGGAVDVYIPHNRISGFFNNIRAKFTKLYVYDVNALYPTIMANTLMPVGKPIAFEGNIRAVESNAYGYFYCKITSPEFLEHPLLQRRIKTSEGVRTIAGLGSWEGWIFSGEMDNAMRFGYTFEILKGYQFKTGYIFKEYVDKMYNLRLEYDKSHPMNLIAKLLMNSLYGKFAMKKDSSIIEIFNSTVKKENQMLQELLETLGESIQDIFKIGDHFITIRKSLSNFNYEDEDDIYHGLEVNIAIASAISAGGRMWMSILKNSSHPNSLLKNHPEFKLYYSDTDSGIIDRPLPANLVGPLLGQFKLEHVVNKAVFLAPKVYGLLTIDGEEIIKVKGLNKDSLDNINFNELESLLIKDSSKEFTQEKWFKKIIEGEITVNEVAYNLKITSNKRAPIHIDNVYSNTKPYNYDEIINNK